MNKMTQPSGTYDDGRGDQFDEMMQCLATLEAKYKGVRGELLAKVRAELAKLKPAATTAATLKAVAPAPAEKAERAATAAAPVASLPSCRVCGRQMKLNGTDGNLVCQNGHIRLL